VAGELNSNPSFDIPFQISPGQLGAAQAAHPPSKPAAILGRRQLIGPVPLRVQQAVPALQHILLFHNRETVIFLTVHPTGWGCASFRRAFHKLQIRFPSRRDLPYQRLIRFLPQ